jgi:3-oxoacyl-[acyl-carrier-protein] synthase II
VIAITGVGVVSSLGASARETWPRVLAGERGIGELTVFEAEAYRTRTVAEVSGIADVVPGHVLSRTSELACRAAREAIADAALPRDRRVGLVVAGTTAGMLETESLLAVLLGPTREVDPEARKEALSRMLSHPLSAPTDRVESELGPFTRVRSLSSACSGGANAILVGASWLELGLVDAVVCGAADALCRVTLAGFNALAALDPAGARPFDKRRRGLTLGEGAGFIVLETRASAEARKKDIVATVLGWASRSEAHHVTNPEPRGEAPVRAMQAALRRAGLTPADVDYVNAHGTGTPLNDPMETRALARVLGDRLKDVPVSSQKGQIGHTLAAAGAIEAVLTALAIRDGVLPPTGGLEEPDPECDLRHVMRAEKHDTRVALSSSFGFGGMDTVLVLGRGDAHEPPRRARRRVVVTGAASVTPAGVRVGPDVASVAEQKATGADVEIDFDQHLDVDRARRLDRASRLAAVVAMRALGAERETDVPSEAGIVFGSAFGAVDATSAFMRRLREKGPRLVSPADFPSLVPSSPAGHVSIQLGLTGPAMVVADLAASGECAFTQAWELAAIGEVDRVVACAVEERSAIVEQVLHAVFRASGATHARTVDDPALARKEGGAAIALAAEDAAEAARLPMLAVVERVVAWTHEADPLASLDPPPGGAIVVFGAANGGGADAVARSRWASCPRVTTDACGTHEAAGGIAIALAAAKVARGEVPAALAVGTARGWGYAVWLRSCASS